VASSTVNKKRVDLESYFSIFSGCSCTLGTAGPVEVKKAHPLALELDATVRVLTVYQSYSHSLFPSSKQKTILKIHNFLY
jgi:hypothetical protein